MHYTLDQLRKAVNISSNISLASRRSLFGQRFVFCCKHISECSYIFFWGLCCSRVDPHFGPFVMSCSKMADSLKTTISWFNPSGRAKVGRSSGVCVCVCIYWVLLVTSGVALKLILVACSDKVMNVPQPTVLEILRTGNSNNMKMWNRF